jgi:hypothetical protein
MAKDWSEAMPRNWKYFRYGRLEFLAPAGVEPQNVAAIDSPANQYSGEGITIIVDTGPFADPLTRYQSYADYRHIGDQVGGRSANIISFSSSDGSHVFAARLTPDDAEAITFAIYLKKGVSDEIALKILRSVRFIL